MRPEGLWTEADGEKRLNQNREPNSVCSDRTHPIRHAFTLIDVLVTMVVIGVLIGIMLPSMAVVRETTRRVVCSSNIRQIGLGISMFADDNHGSLPSTVFVATGFDRVPNETTRLRIASGSSYSARFDDGGDNTASWDGLGLLYHDGYLETPGVFYCPSHKGDHRLQDQTEAWHDTDSNIFGNYQFRGEGPDGRTKIFQIVPRRAAIVSDSIRSEADLNHESGMNILRADLAVFWFGQLTPEVLSLLESDDSASTMSVWREFDGVVSGG